MTQLQTLFSSVWTYRKNQAMIFWVMMLYYTVSEPRRPQLKFSLL